MQLPRLRPDQYAIATNDAKIKTIAMGRRWGKTVMAGSIALAEALGGAEVAWVVPTYRNARVLWRFIEQHAAQAGVLHRSDMSVIFKRGRVAIYTADNDIALRGEAFDIVIVDEAARIREETYTDVLMPTLADRDGIMLLISTPKGRNWFWREWIRGVEHSERYASFTAPSSDNPSAAIVKATELAKEFVSDRTYRQEWLAEFVDDAGGVFRGVTECIRQYAPAPEANKNYVMGIDWGRTNDATVFTVICVEDAQVVAIERMTQTAYHLQLDRLQRLCAIWQPYDILAEANSIGNPLVEALQRLELPVRAFITTAITKTPLIDALALAIERKEIGLINNATLIGELQAYQSERLPSGIIRFNAPTNMHDDMVISLALAWKAAKQSSNMVLFEA